MRFFKNMFQKNFSQSILKPKGNRPSFIIYDFMKDERVIVSIDSNDFLQKKLRKSAAYRLDNSTRVTDLLLSTGNNELNLTMLIQLSYKMPSWYGSEESLDFTKEKKFLIDLSKHYSEFLDKTLSEEIVNLTRGEKEGPEYHIKAKATLKKIMKELFFDSLVLLEAEMIANSPQASIKPPAELPDIDRLLSSYRSSEFKAKLIETSESMRNGV